MRSGHANSKPGTLNICDAACHGALMLDLNEQCRQRAFHKASHLDRWTQAGVDLRVQEVAGIAVVLWWPMAFGLYGRVAGSHESVLDCCL